MSAAPDGQAPARRRKPKAKEKKSILTMDIGSIGKKTVDDEDVDHPPFEPTLPRVNLLPASVPTTISLRKVRRRFIAAGIVLLLGAGGFWYVQGNQIIEAETRLAQSRAETTALQTKVTAMAPVKEFYTQLSQQQELVATTFAAQARTEDILQRMRAAAQEASGGGRAISITSISIQYSGIPTPGGPLNICSASDPFSADIAVGCLNFTATAANREQVVRLLSLMEADSTFVGPYITGTTAAEGVEQAEVIVTFSGTAGLSPDSLVVPLTPEQIDALLNPPAPDANPVPSAAAATP
jgi:hypothetical protein